MHSPIGAGHEASIGEDKLKTIHRRYVTQIIPAAPELTKDGPDHDQLRAGSLTESGPTRTGLITLDMKHPGKPSAGNLREICTLGLTRRGLKTSLRFAY